MAKTPSGSKIGGYRIEEQIGRGGMGVVYRATHIALDKQVALKVIAEELAEDEGFRERFRREPKLAASIDHPNVIPVFDAGEDGDQLFVAMRIVEGSDLRSVIATEGRLEPERAARIVAQVAEALDAAHDLGLVHRDVKPGNVLIETRRGVEHVYLTDFGLTKGGEGSAALTKTGQWVGTPDYVAPEQIHGGVLDRRTDIYALGAVLYHTLSGQPPYGRETEVAKIYAHLSKPPPELPDDVDAPAELKATIRRAMAKEPTDRYSSAGELGREAIAAAGGDPGRLSSETAALTIPAAVPGETAIADAGTAPGETAVAPGETAPAPGKTALGAGATAPAGAGATAPAGAGATAPAGAGVTAAAGAGVTAAAGAGATTAAGSGTVAADAAQPGSRTAARTPVTKRFDTAGGRRTLLVVGLVGAVILAAAGFALGSSGGDGDTDAASFSNSASAGTLGLSFPGGWDQASQGLSVAGIDFQDPISLAPADGGDGAGLVAGQVAASGPSLLPAGFVRSVGGEPPRDDAVKLGDLEAYRYADLQQTGFDGQLTVFTVPTSAGVATIACAIPSGAGESVSDDCEQIATTLALTGAKPFPLGPDEQYGNAVNKSVSGLNEARDAKLKDLRDAKTPDAQASALNELSAAYGNAAQPLKGLEISPAVEPTNGAIVAALGAGEDAYKAMADAASSDDDGNYDAARTDARRADARLNRALGRLSALGYKVG